MSTSVLETMHLCSSDTPLCNMQYLKLLYQLKDSPNKGHDSKLPLYKGLLTDAPKVDFSIVLIQPLNSPLKSGQPLLQWTD